MSLNLLFQKLLKVATFVRTGFVIHNPVNTIFVNSNSVNYDGVNTAIENAAYGEFRFATPGHEPATHFVGGYSGQRLVDTITNIFKFFITYAEASRPQTADRSTFFTLANINSCIAIGYAM